jgi:large subunit ribosomal protein L25
VPEKLEIDLADTKIGENLRWSSIRDHFGARPGIVGRDFMVASVAAPTVEVEAAPVAAAAPEPAKGKGKAAPAKAAPAKAPAAAAPAKKK